MSRIHLLDNSLIDKIAAGEVVERPASAVKELMENSIDAGATTITVEIREGGIGYIRVSDNGKGIPRDEITTAFMRHATSKLSTFKDLDNILTLGFRGEALSSIASVADVEMITRTAKDTEGTKVELGGGRVIDQSPCAAEIGTIITVKNLFYNTPVRRKFLKKPSTEAGYVADVVNRIALGHPHIGVKYINNGNVMLQTSGNNDLKVTAFHIYGKDYSLKLIPAKGEKEGYRLEGLVGRPELGRGNRTYGNFFINGRYVKSELVSSAVEEAYKGRLMGGRFPVFILNMTVPEATVDVNVHPTKLEVRFSDEDLIYSLVLDTVTKALAGEELIPRVEWSKPEEKPKAAPVQERLDVDMPKEVLPSTVADNQGMLRLSEDYNKGGSSFSRVVNQVYNDMPSLTVEEPKNKAIAKEINTYNIDKKPEVQEEIKTEPKPKEKPYSFFNHYSIVGQVFATYWLVEQEDKLYLIDQHAAHERVLYERLRDRMRQGEVASQLLLQPIAMSLSEREMELVEENRELLESFGYDVEPLGLKSIALRSVPFIFNEPTGGSFFLEIVDTLGDRSLRNVYDAKLDTIATMSCKAAVKANDRLSFTEAKALIEDMLKLENPFSCPHGRPTIIEMTKYELEKKFKRIV